MSQTIVIEGLANAKKYLNSKNTNAIKLIKEGIVKASVYLQGEVKESIAGRRAEHVSVDTGRFLNSVEFQASEFQGKVFTKVPYADHLEYSTNFKNSPRKHFTNSADRSKQKITSLIKDAISKI